MKKTARILFLFLLLSLTVMLASCGGGGEKDKTYKVMVSPTAGATVTSENPVTVREGEDAVFTVTLDEGYIYQSSAGAEYSPEDGTLTVRNVRKNTNIDFWEHI